VPPGSWTGICGSKLVGQAQPVELGPVATCMAAQGAVSAPRSWTVESVTSPWRGAHPQGEQDPWGRTARAVLERDREGQRRAPCPTREEQRHRRSQHIRPAHNRGTRAPLDQREEGHPAGRTQHTARGRPHRVLSSTFLGSSGWVNYRRRLEMNTQDRERRTSRRGRPSGIASHAAVGGAEAPFSA
jgi:hypothetical protein